MNEDDKNYFIFVLNYTYDIQGVPTKIYIPFNRHTP